ncbi:hypothetical protein PtrSN002B_009251 [Pyrenophora tritici-repentis]|nr:hypothetical protein Alg215_05423 [Pyrenophora tritici-repentis]KAI1537955.1 hypothetical protein PtrSN002B_009251 [Pyrenophora tritici-repentis]KAI1570725.1 hypothetical protein PtrEW4_005186 [Pyrenophora tritici-repentis]KAI1583274.1 hypothetical protein PtrEW13061_008890 [Pyrenophora tritici-repentis]PZD33836.1 hypothetical protein A1F96_01960 [Pyrenophora tritici-repentis]
MNLSQILNGTAAPEDTNMSALAYRQPLSVQEMTAPSLQSLEQTPENPIFDSRLNDPNRPKIASFYTNDRENKPHGTTSHCDLVSGPESFELYSQAGGEPLMELQQKLRQATKVYVETIKQATKVYSETVQRLSNDYIGHGRGTSRMEVVPDPQDEPIENGAFALSTTTNTQRSGATIGLARSSSQGITKNNSSRKYSVNEISKISKYSRCKE